MTLKQTTLLLAMTVVSAAAMGQQFNRDNHSSEGAKAPKTNYSTRAADRPVATRRSDFSSFSSRATRPQTTTTREPFGQRQTSTFRDATTTRRFDSNPGTLNRSQSTRESFGRTPATGGFTTGRPSFDRPGNETTAYRRGGPGLEPVRQNLEPTTGRRGGPGLYPTHPIDEPTTGRRGGPGLYPVHPVVPPFHGGWNYGSNRTVVDNIYHEQIQTHIIQVQNNYIYQNPIWGGHWRMGYCAPAGFDVSFHAGLYLFSPFEAACYVSPWYSYSNLPPYIPSSEVMVLPSYSCDWTVGTPYAYREGYGDAGLNQAIENIQAAFVEKDPSAISTLLPASGRVGVFNDGRYDYSMADGEFYNMFADSVQGCDTLSFRVDRVLRSGPYATVNCVHRVETGQGEETVFQSYRLRSNGFGRYVVTDFMTNHGAAW